MDAASGGRRVLSVEEYGAAVNAACEEAGALLYVSVAASLVVDVTVAALAAVGILTPAPEPDPADCTAQYPDPYGDWHQCQQRPGHGGRRHDSGEWDWVADAPNALPPLELRQAGPTVEQLAAAGA